MIKSATAVLHFAREQVFFLSFSPPCGSFPAACPPLLISLALCRRPEARFRLQNPPFSSSFCPLFSPTPPCLLSTSTTFEKKLWTFFKKQGRISEKQWTFSTEVVHRPQQWYKRHAKAVQAEREAPHRHKKIGDHTRTNVCDRRKFLRLFRPTCRLQAGNRRVGNESREPQPRIMVRSILKRTLALSAWGTPAGMMSISPAATR